MAVRPIDAVQVLHNINLHRRPTPVSEVESGFNNGLNQAMWEITHAPTLTPPNEWVRVEERLPEDEKDGEIVLVIVFGKPHENITLHGAIMTAGYFQDEGWVLNEYPEWEGPEITHWMPLPAPPDRRPPEGEEK